MLFMAILMGSHNVMVREAQRETTMIGANYQGYDWRRNGRNCLPLLCFLLNGVNAVYCRQAIGQGATPSTTSAKNVTVQKVENAGLLFTDNPAGVSGVDAGYSLPMGNRTLWLFGDVFLLAPTDPAKPYVGGVSNCGLLVPAGQGVAPLRQYTFLTDAKTGLAHSLLRNAPGEGNEIRYWPFGGWYDNAAHQVYLYYARIRNTGGGPLDFRIEGHGLAVADAGPSLSALAGLQFRRLDAAPGQPLWWTDLPKSTAPPTLQQPPGQSANQSADPSANRLPNPPTGMGAAQSPPTKSPLFGSAVVSGTNDGFLYVVGVQERGGRKWGKLARVPAKQIADLRAYEYYVGLRPAERGIYWSRDISEAADVDGLNDFPNELSVSYNAYLGGWLAVHSVNVSDKVRLSFASKLTGPYKTIGEIGAPHKAFARAFCYAGKEHPELRQASGRIIYITYVDSDRYWLQLLKVTLQK